MKKILLLLLSISFMAVQAQDSKGDDFWIGFTPNISSTSNTIQVYLTSDVNTNATVSAPGISFNQNVAITAGVISTVTIPSTISPSAFSVQSRAVHITANDEISVYGLNAQAATTDAFLAFPTDALGLEYYIMSYESNLGYPAQGLIVATENGTTVTITPTFTNGGLSSGVATNVSLSEGEVYLLASGGSGSDITGTKVVSNKPVAVFGGNQCVQVPTGNTFCDHIVSQIQPNDSWGKTFYTAPLETRLNGDRFRILAQTNSTQIKINGAIITTLNAGEFYETVLSGGNVIEGSEPILVAQFSHSTSYDGVTSDPFMLIVPPSDQYLPQYTVGTVNMIYNPSTQVNFLNIISPNGNTANVMVNGSAVATWVAIGTSGFSYAQIQVPNGQHSITSTLPIGLYMYGFASVESYGYVGGQSFSPVATVNSLSLNVTQVNAFQAQQVCVQATVLDQNSNPVVGVLVQLNLALGSANAGQTSFGTTDINGQVTLCYQTCLAGIDSAIATIAGLADTVIVNVAATTLDVLPPLLNTNLGAQSCVSATMLDPSLLPVPNALVTFEVIGDNPLPPQPVFTNALGLAQYCYTPGMVGIDTILVTAACANGDIDTVVNTITSGGVPCPPLSISFTPYDLKPFWGTNDPYTFYFGVTQWKRIKASVSGGVGPFTYTWGKVGPGGAMINTGSALNRYLYQPMGPTKVYLDVFDSGTNCTYSDTVTINWSDEFFCGSTSPKLTYNLWMCQGGVSMCVPWGTAKSAIKGGQATLGQCPVSKVETIHQLGLTVYPNPNSGLFTVKHVAENYGEGDLMVFDMNGRMVFRKDVEVLAGPAFYDIDLSGLANGSYIIKLIGDHDVYTDRVQLLK